MTEPKTIRLYLLGVLFLLISTLMPLQAQQEVLLQAESDADIRLTATAGIGAWLEENPYWQKFAATPFYKDLSLSAQFLDLSNLRHRLEKQVGADITNMVVRELLRAPLDLSLYQLFDQTKPTLFIAVLDLEPQLAALVKLAEAYAQTTKTAGRTTVLRRNNLDILETVWDKQTIYHLTLGGQLIVANHMDTLLRETAAALSGNGGKCRPFASSDFYKKYHRDQKGNFKIQINLMSRLAHFREPLDKKRMDLAVNMDLNKSLTIHNLTISADPGFEDIPQKGMRHSKALIPQDPVVALCGTMPSRRYLDLIKQLPGFNERNTEPVLDIDKDIQPLFNNAFFLYLDALQTQADQPFLRGLIGFSLEKSNAAQREKLAHFARILMTRTGLEMKAVEEPGHMAVVYRYDDPNLPAFAVLGRWLLVASDYPQLKQSLLVQAKRRASVSDSPAYKALNGKFNAACNWHVLVDTARFFTEIGLYMKYLAGNSSQYNAADIESKILPVTDILAKIPSFGIFLTLTQQELTGTLDIADR